MAQLTITIPDPQVDRVREAFSPLARKEPADMTAQDVTDVLIEYVINITKQYEEDVANIAAQASVTEIDVT